MQRLRGIQVHRAILEAAMKLRARHSGTFVSCTRHISASFFNTFNSCTQHYMDIEPAHSSRVQKTQSSF
jgi:hypothetical protein